MTITSSEHQPDLHAVLRSATAPAHLRLETALALLDPPLQKARFLTILQRFWGFHRVWEGQLAEQAALLPLLAGRGRLAMLENDLTALGMSVPAIEALPLCTAANRLGGSVARLLGSLYVLEGSTLGGQLISRTLSTEAWLPEGGLTYFNPYGARTGVMWREFKAALDRASGPQADAVIIAGAQDSFELLREWLSR